MTDDIVARIRDYQATVLAAPPYYRELVAIAADEIERLRKERDEARREICKGEADLISLELGGAAIFAASVAKRRGWDCFKDSAEHRVGELRAQLREYTGDNHTINAARRGDPSGVQTPSEGHLE